MRYMSTFHLPDVSRLLFGGALAVAGFCMSCYESGQAASGVLELAPARVLSHIGQRGRPTPFDLEDRTLPEAVAAWVGEDDARTAGWHIGLNEQAGGTVSESTAANLVWALQSLGDVSIEVGEPSENWEPLSRLVASDLELESRPLSWRLRADLLDPDWLLLFRTLGCEQLTVQGADYRVDDLDDVEVAEWSVIRLTIQSNIGFGMAKPSLDPPIAPESVGPLVRLLSPNALTLSGWALDADISEVGESGLALEWVRLINCIVGEGFLRSIDSEVLSGVEVFGESDIGARLAELVRARRSLTALYVESCTWPEAALDWLTGASAIESLSVSGAAGRRALSSLSGMPSIRLLSVSSGDLDAEDLVRIGDVGSLETLSIANCGGVTCERLESVGRLTGLRHLALISANVDERVLPILAEMKRLRTLDLHGVAMDRRAFSKWKEGMPDLQVLGVFLED
ncbi:MAG: hypothetical protein R3F34_08150 [Planctomycetota bacterium]